MRTQNVRDMGALNMFALKENFSAEFDATIKLEVFVFIEGVQGSAVQPRAAANERARAGGAGFAGGGNSGMASPPLSCF